ncbi:response regulator, partial [Chloroflexota bacterium]
MSIRIILVDDHKIVREGLHSLLSAEQDMEVIAEAAEGRMAVRLARELSPDVVILDIAMPGLNGIEAARQIRTSAPNVKIVALSMHSDKRFVTEAFRAGASGYLLKDCAFEELSRAIHAVTANQIYMSPSIAGILIEDYVKLQLTANTSPGSILTAREREVLQLLSEGKAVKEIASLLQVSVKTVETHRMRIMKKLNVHSTA